MKKNIVEQKVLKEYFDYNPSIGKLINKKKRPRCEVGTISVYTHKHDGYARISFKGKTYSEHILIWIWMFNEVPDNIDHINGIRDDNRLCNLRNVSHKINMQNQRLGTRHKSYSNVPGVFYDKRKDKYRIRLMSPDGVYKSFGLYNDVKEAEKRCIELRRIYYPGNTL